MGPQQRHRGQESTGLEFAGDPLLQRPHPHSGAIGRMLAPRIEKVCRNTNQPPLPIDNLDQGRRLEEGERRQTADLLVYAQNRLNGLLDCRVPRTDAT